MSYKNLSEKKNMTVKIGFCRLKEKVSKQKNSLDIFAFTLFIAELSCKKYFTTAFVFFSLRSSRVSIIKYC